MLKALFEQQIHHEIKFLLVIGVLFVMSSKITTPAKGSITNKAKFLVNSYVFVQMTNQIASKGRDM